MRGFFSTDDEHLTRLPWILLADAGIFLAAAGWSVALSARGSACPCCELPPSPNLLIIAPEPQNVNPTQTDAHIAELLGLLSAADHHFAPDKHVRIARTWEEFIYRLKTFASHCVYYYGHGVGDSHHARLVFGSGALNERKNMPVADVANCFRNLRDLTLDPSPLTGVGILCWGIVRPAINGRSQRWSRLKPAAEFRRTLQRPSAFRLAIDRQETGRTSLFPKLYLSLSGAGGVVCNGHEYFLDRFEWAAKLLLKFITLLNWLYQTRSLGGRVKFLTGGDSPRTGNSWSGAIPEPTVKVWME